MKLPLLFVVARKELTDALRDRRSLFSALVGPLIGPLIVIVMFSMLIERERIDEGVRLPVVGAEHAPGLIAVLRQHDIETEDPPEDPRAAVRAGVVPAVLVIPPDASERFRAGQTVKVDLIFDGSRKESRAPVRRVERVIEAHAAELGVYRLLARGVDPQLARPITTTSVDLATSRQQAAELVGMIVPLFVILAATVGGTFVAVDGTAGERERGSLEPLLGLPVARFTLACGKWLASVVMSTTSLVLTVITLSFALQRLPLDEIGLPLHFGAAEATAIALAVLPLALLMSGVQIVVGTVTRSFREAQTYLSLLTMVPMLPAFYTNAASLDPAPWMHLTPVLAQHVLMLTVLRGEPIEPIGAIAGSVVTIGLAIACVAAVARLLSRERTLFGG